MTQQVTLNVGQVVVELAQVVVPLVVHHREDGAAGQLWQILQGEKKKCYNQNKTYKKIKIKLRKKM